MKFLCRHDDVAQLGGSSANHSSGSTWTPLRIAAQPAEDAGGNVDGGGIDEEADYIYIDSNARPGPATRLANGRSIEQVPSMQ